MGTVTSWGEAILTALGNALNLLLTFIPRFLGFLVILLVGWLIASLVSKAVAMLLRKVGFDRVSKRIGLTTFEQRMGLHMDSAGILGQIVFWFLFLIFLVPAADTLGVPAVSNILNQLVDYIPNVFVAILVLFLGTLAATVVADLVRGATSGTSIGNPHVFAALARWTIIGFAVLIALEQLDIAPALISILFTAIVGGLAIAFGLAFGLGGQEAARRWLNRGESLLEHVGPQLSQQIASSSTPQATPTVYPAQQPVAPAYPAQQPAAPAYPPQASTGAYAPPPVTPPVAETYQAPAAPPPPPPSSSANDDTVPNQPAVDQ
jgi:hypothetical protein